MPSRQERRKAERDAAKRAPAQAAAAGAAIPAAARANVHVNPLGDWTTQENCPRVLFNALGSKILRQRAAEGDGEAQFSLGYSLVGEADGAAGKPLGCSGRSPMADVGLVPRTAQFPGRSPDSDASITCRPNEILLLRVPTLTGGGHGASGAGGRARARVRYECAGQHSPPEEPIRTSFGVVHQGRRGRAAESDVQPWTPARPRGGHDGARLPGDGGLVQVRPGGYCPPCHSTHFEPSSRVECHNTYDVVCNIARPRVWRTLLAMLFVAL